MTLGTMEREIDRWQFLLTKKKKIEEEKGGGWGEHVKMH